MTRQHTTVMNLAIAATCSGLLSLGCATADYNVVILNRGPQTVRSAHVIYGDFTSAGGILSAGAKSVHMEPNHPIPDQATVEWRTQDGQMHQKVVEVKKLIPRGFSGDIYFDIDDSTNVTVRPVPRR